MIEVEHQETGEIGRVADQRRALAMMEHIVAHDYGRQRHTFALRAEADSELPMAEAIIDSTNGGTSWRATGVYGTQRIEHGAHRPNLRAAWQALEHGAEGTARDPENSRPNYATMEMT